MWKICGKFVEKKKIHTNINKSPHTPLIRRSLTESTSVTYISGGGWLFRPVQFFHPDGRTRGPDGQTRANRCAVRPVQYSFFIPTGEPLRGSARTVFLTHFKVPSRERERVERESRESELNLRWLPVKAFSQKSQNKKNK